MGELLVIFLGSFAWLLWNMAPFLTVGDSGEFVVTGATLGVAHAPGYPLYVILEKLVQIFFPGNEAYRSNLLSVCCVSAAWTGLWYFWRRRLQSSKSAALVVIMALAASKYFMIVATETEVFALLAASAIFLFWIFENGFLLLGSFLFGLFLGNHHTLVLLGPAFAVLAVGFLWPVHDWKKLARHLLVCAAAFGVGLSIYGFLPAAASRGPVFNWGNPTTIKRFWHVLSRKDYGSTTLTVEGAQQRNASAYWAQTRRFLESFYRHFPAAVIGILGLLGVIALYWSGKVFLSWALILGFVLSGPFFLFLGNPPFDAQTAGALERFFLLPLVCLAVAAPMGFQMILRRLGGLKAIGSSVGILMVAVGCWAFHEAGSPWRRREDFLVYDFGKNLLRGVLPGAYFLMEGGDDPMYTMAYLLFVEGRRQDLGQSHRPKELHIGDRAGLVYPSLYGFEFRSTPRDQREKLRAVVENRLAQEHQLIYQTLKLELVKPAQLLPLGIVQWRRKESRIQDPGSRVQEREIGKFSSFSDIGHWTLDNGQFFSFWPFYSFRGLDGPPRRHYRERAMIPYYYFARGQTRLWQGDASQAVQDWLAAIRKGGDALWVNLNVHLEAGEQAARLVDQGKFSQALMMAQLAQKAGPQEPSYAVNECVILDRLGRLKDSLACYESARVKFSSYALLYKNWGATLISDKKVVQAREKFQRYYELSGDQQALGWMQMQ